MQRSSKRGKERRLSLRGEKRLGIGVLGKDRRVLFMRRRERTWTTGKGLLLEKDRRIRERTRCYV